MKTLIALLVVCLGLVSCKQEAPDLSRATTATVETHARVAGIDKATLTTLAPAQIKALAGWISAHRTDWYFKLEDTGPGIFVTLKDDAGRIVVVNIHEQFVCSGQSYRNLSPAEWSELRKIFVTENN